MKKNSSIFSLTSWIAISLCCLFELSCLGLILLAVKIDYNDSDKFDIAGEIISAIYWLFFKNIFCVISIIINCVYLNRNLFRVEVPYFGLLVTVITVVLLAFQFLQYVH